jgi:hypothetical protein
MSGAGTKRKRNNTYRPNNQTFRNKYRSTKLLQTELNKYPIYLIYAHACICTKPKTCFKANHEKTFTIPSDTFILNSTDAGETCISNLPDMFNSVYDYRPYLLIHSSSDMLNNNAPSSYSIFDHMNRATTGSAYPNIAFTMNEFSNGVLKDPSEYNYGVYDIEKINETVDDLKTLRHTMSIISQDKNKVNWGLSDIIQEVYEKTKINKGIFVLSGCLVACEDRPKSKNSTAIYQKGLNESATLIQTANIEYLKRDLLSTTNKDYHKLTEFFPIRSRTTHRPQMTNAYEAFDLI